ncbi:MAG: ATP-binding protein [Marinoscillum sp.]
MWSPLQFRVSAALKNIIGKDLITDDYIAVFELVKNSFDAHATHVKIIFENNKGSNPRILIIDNGKGMNYQDLTEKWLFVAYSAKYDGTEDANYDYRDIINQNRAYAGAKGIGRFSCDRLGRKLNLESTKDEENPTTHRIETDWTQFEQDLQQSFIDVSVNYSTQSSSDFGLNHGTALVISELRSEWDRDKILKLKDSLAKLVNPSRGRQELEFKIEIEAIDELELDSEEIEDHNKVNGPVQNFIFETLGLRTSKIISIISNEGDIIKSKLVDGGTTIYSITERNQYSLLKKIEITIYYLNQSAKNIFTRRMGLASINYGHVFLYKNGFRIYPYGEPGEDPLKIDRRKSQGQRRYLGTREIIGQIEIWDDTEELKETSSRGDGLIKTETYLMLEEFFWNTLRRLERYVVDVQKWGLSIDDEENDQDIHNRITDLIARISNSKELIDFSYSEDFINILERSQSNSANTIVNNLNKLALETGSDKLIKETNKAAKILAEIQKAREEAEHEASLAQESLDVIESENLFLKSVKSQDLDEMVSFLHSVGISADIIQNYINGMYKRVNRGEKISPNELSNKLREMSLENQKIIALAKFSTKANFKMFTEEVDQDIFEFIHEYMLNIVKPIRSENIVISSKYSKVEKHTYTFRPIELTIILDNLVSNSIRAKATSFHVKYAFKEDSYEVSLTDDGTGIPESNLSKIFDMGFTTTKGSGLGLFHIQNIIRSSENISIDVNSKVGIGTTFKLNFKR